LYTGTASWFVRYKFRGRPKRKVLGDVRVLDRKVALEAARNELAKIQLFKNDPAAAKRDAMRTAKVTFGSVVPGFLAHKREEKKRSRTLTGYERYLTGYYFEPLHKLPLDEITGQQISVEIDNIKTESGMETAYSCRSLIRDFFNWAIDSHKLPEDYRNPASKLLTVAKNAPRERVLLDDEIRVIWKTCEDWEAETLAFEQSGQRRAPGGFSLLTDYPRAVQLLFLTGLRAQEIGDLHWSELDLDHGEIRIVKQRTKQKRELCNPLPDMATEILRKIKAEAARPGDPCVFGRGDGKGAPSRRSIILLDDGVKWKTGLYMGDTVRKIQTRFRRGDIGFWKHEIDPAKKRRIHYLLAARIPIRQIMLEEQLAFRTVERIKASLEAGPVPEAQPAPSMPHWTMHDIRRTFRTGLSECGVSINIGEAIVGHRHVSKLVGTYDKYEYWAEKRVAMAKWQDRFRSILDGTAPKIEAPRFGRKLAAQETTP
jgi:integrase